MAQINIDSLPEEILINIFGYLSPKMMKTCCSVTKRWNQIIKDSKAFKDRFRLKLNYWEALDNYMNNEYSRNFDSVFIHPQNLFNCIFEGFKNVVNPRTLTSLELVRFKMKLSELVELLNYLPELEVLVLKDVTLDGYPRALTKKAKVKKLKKLKLYGQSFILDNFLKTLDIDTLKEFAVEFSSDSNYTSIKQWIKLLEEQKELQNLTLGQSATWLFFQFPEIFNFKFPLTRFNMKGNQIGININVFFKFLTIHSGTLEKLILHGMPPEYVFEVYEFIWNKLPDIKDTDLSARDFYRYDRMLEAHPELKERYTGKLASIEKVDFLGFIYEWDIRGPFFKLILSKFSNAKIIDLSKINLDMSWNRIIRHIGKEMKNLTVLRMPEKFGQKVLKNIHFQKLTEFSIGKIEDIERVRRFIRRHSRTLEKVSFTYSDINLLGTIIDEIRYCKNNKLVTIRAHPKEAARLFNILRRRARGNKSWNLRLEICKDYPPKYIFKYKFPDDVAFWNCHNNFWSRLLAKETWTMSAIADEIKIVDFLSINFPNND